MFAIQFMLIELLLLLIAVCGSQVIAPLVDKPNGNNEHGTWNSGNNNNRLSRATDQIVESDFNPQLSGKTPGLPLLGIRFNQRAFQYSSVLLNPIIGNEVKKSRVPPIKHCTQEFNGCINLYNLYVSRFRCPQKVAIYPAPLDRFVINVRNLDVGISGNLGGDIVMLIPVHLTGIVQISAHQVSITAQFSVYRSSSGTPMVKIVGCYVSVGYTDIIIQRGGLVGDIFNSQFRSKASQQLRDGIPAKICQTLPILLKNKLGPKLKQFPNKIPISAFTSLADGISKGVSITKMPPQCKSAKCQNKLKISDGITHLSAPTASAAAVRLFSLTGPNTKPIKIGRGIQFINGTSSVASLSFKRDDINGPKFSTHSAFASKIRQRREAIRLQRVTLSPITQSHPIFARGVGTLNDQLDDPCDVCMHAKSINPLSELGNLTKSIDLNKLKDIELWIELLRASASASSFALWFGGEFSPHGRHGLTPFSPFPMQFPDVPNRRMVEVLISDFAVNSLFYHMHRRDFITFRIGPETPKIGSMLKTTCSDEDYGDDQDFDLDQEEEAAFAEHVATNSSKRRRKRQLTDDDEDGLEGLGVCLGDIMPAVREKFPKKLLYIILRTTQAPSLILTARAGGLAIASLIAEASFYIEDSNDKVGTMVISIQLEMSIATMGNHLISEADVKYLKLIDKEETFGLPQEALDNLANLSKEVIAKMANDALANGLVVRLPTSKLPLRINKPQLRVTEHALYFTSDFTILPSALGISSRSICRRL